MGTRIEEHQKEVEALSNNAYTRTKRKASEKEHNKSAITDHSVTNNHVIDWDGVRVVDRESDTTRRRIREAIWIKRRGTTMNRDQGAVYLPRVWNTIVADLPPSGSKIHRS